MKIISKILGMLLFVGLLYFNLDNKGTQQTTPETAAVLTQIELSTTEVLAGDCPNGCLTNVGNCYCNGWHDLEEYCWTAFEC